MKLARAIAVALVVAALPARGDEVIRTSGTGTALGTIRRLGEAYARAHPGRRLEVFQSVGSTGALQAVARGALDVGLTGRPLEPSERALGLEAIPFARTPFVFAAGPRAGVTTITAGEVARIYRGDVRTWPGGERIRPVMRPTTDVDVAIMRAISPEISSALDAAQRREGMLMAVTNQECQEILARTPGAFGATTLAQLRTEPGAPAALAWNGVAPTVPNLASGAYPLAKTLYAVFRAPPSPEVRRFVEYLSSPEAHRILDETGSLPLASRRGK